MATTGFDNLFKKEDIEYIQDKLDKKGIVIHPYDVGVLLYKYRDEEVILDKAPEYTFDEKLKRWYRGERKIYNSDR